MSIYPLKIGLLPSSSRMCSVVFSLLSKYVVVFSAAIWERVKLALLKLTGHFLHILFAWKDYKKSLLHFASVYKFC